MIIRHAARFKNLLPSALSTQFTSIYLTFDGFSAFTTIAVTEHARERNIVNTLPPSLSVCCPILQNAPQNYTDQRGRSTFSRTDPFSHHNFPCESFLHVNL